MRTSRVKRRRLSREQRRRHIVGVATNLFAEKGFNGVRTREIAEQAGISEALVFKHFKDKEDLYRAALHDLFVSLDFPYDIEELLRIDDDLLAFRTLALDLIKHKTEDPKAVRLAIFDALDDGQNTYGVIHRPEEFGLKAPHELIAAYIQKRIDDGKFKKMNAQIAAQLFIIQVVFTYVLSKKLSVSGPALPVSDDEAVEALVSIFLNGIRA
jgi:TetR/AcrR family transcriptional regulator